MSKSPEERKIKLNGGWVLTLIAWIISSVFIPFLPEMIRYKSRNVFGYPLMEYVATIGLFAVIFLFVWIPVGIWAGNIYKTKGINKSLIAIVTSFVLLVFFWLFVFTFLWNS